MVRSNILKAVLSFVVCTSVFLPAPFTVAQDARPRRAQESTDTTGTADAVLWREPTDVASRDLFLGPGGEEKKPDLSQITFVSENKQGYSVKYHVKDGSGHKWVIKLGNEARPETAAVRLIWAIGDVTDVNYLVPCVHI